MTARRLGLAALWAGCLTAAFLAGRTSRRERPAPAEVTLRERCAPSTQDGVSAETVRAILRQELATRGEAVPAETPAAAPAPEPTVEASPVAPRAEAIVDNALARGVWAADDRDALRALIGQLSRAETEALFQRIVPAVNEGRMRVDVGQGPLI